MNPDFSKDSAGNPRNPLVSVIVPNYNYARFLDERMRSVLGQTYPEMEVTVLDDRSTDGSLEVLEKYKSDPRLTGIVISEENSGSPSEQWAKGIAAAGGELVWIAEADDYCSLDMLQDLVDAFRRTQGCVLAYARSQIVDENGSPLRSDATNSTADVSLSGRDFVNRYLISGCDVKNASSAVFSRAAAMEILDKEWRRLPTANDYMFWTQLASLGNVAIVNRRLNFFRRHSAEQTTAHDADGSNLAAEKTVVDSMRLSPVRRYVAYAIRRRSIRKARFDDENLRESLLKLWNRGFICEAFDTFVTKVYYKLNGYKSPTAGE